MNIKMAVIKFLAILFSASHAFAFYHVSPPSCYSSLFATNIDSNKNSESTKTAWFPTSYPSKDDAQRYLESNIDYSLLKPDDPRFLDMPWPKELGKESAAFSKHFLWRRSLTDGERMRWQRWAIYQRLGQNNLYDYSVEDYILQNLMKDVDSRALSLINSNKSMEAIAWSSLGKGLRAKEYEDAKGTVLAYYSNFNRKYVDGVRGLWLPNSEVELVVPGYEKARGSVEVTKLYQRVLKETKPFGKVKPSILKIISQGNIAVVFTLEMLEAGTDLRTVRRKNKQNPPQPDKQKTKPPIKLLATSVLRNANKQWRFLMHHVTPFESSQFTGNPLDIKGLSYSPIIKTKVDKTSNSKIFGETPLDSLETILRNSIQASRARRQSSKSAANGIADILPLSPPSSSLDAPSVNEKQSGISEEKEGLQTNEVVGDKSLSSVINPKGCLAKQTIQLTKHLLQTNLISKSERDVLIDSIIESSSKGKVSLAESAFQLAFGKQFIASNVEDKAIEEFVSNCKFIIKSLAIM